MIIPNEKRFHGKFRKDSNRANTGRISVPSELVIKKDFPFTEKDTVYITMRDGVLILEKRNDGIEPVLADKQCKALDCDNNLYGRCCTNLELNDKAVCLKYSFSKNKFSSSLKDKVLGGLNDSKSKQVD